MKIIGVNEKILEYFTCGPGATCSRCGNQLTFFSKQKYFNLVLPMWPLGKSLTARCTTCDVNYTEEQLSPRILDEAKRRRRKGTSSGMFAGSIVLFVVVPLIISGALRSRRDHAGMINEPEEGNVYLVKDEHERGFVYYKLMDFRNDSLLLSPHSAWFPNEKSASERHGNYDMDSLHWRAISRQDLKDWEKSGKLRKINKW